MAFAKNEKGVHTDEHGNVTEIKYDKHVLPGDDDWGTYVPVSTAPVEREDLRLAREQGESNQDETGEQLLITDAEAREALDHVGPGEPGPLERLAEAKEAQDKADEKNAESSEAKADKPAPASKPVSSSKPSGPAGD